jgi:hypothetical protein
VARINPDSTQFFSVGVSTGRLAWSACTNLLSAASVAPRHNSARTTDEFLIRPGHAAIRSEWQAVR